MRLALLILLLTGAVAGGSYRQLSAADEARFFRTGGEAFTGRSIHLHLTPTPFMKPPGKAQPTSAGVKYHLYTYRGVKFLVHPRNPYYEQFRRKRKRGKIVCVKGKVLRFGPEIGVGVLIHRIRALAKPKRTRR